MDEQMEVKLRIPDEWREIIENYTREKNVDETTAIRMLAYEELKRYTLKLLSEGKITIRQAAKALGKSIWEIIDLAVELGYELGPTGEQVEKSLKHVEEYIKKIK